MSATPPEKENTGCRWGRAGSLLVVRRRLSPDRGRRPVYYADCRELERAIETRYGLRPGGQVRTGG